MFMQIFFRYFDNREQLSLEPYLKPYQSSMMEGFAEIAKAVNYFRKALQLRCLTES